MAEGTIDLVKFFVDKYLTENCKTILDIGAKNSNYAKEFSSKVVPTLLDIVPIKSRFNSICQDIMHYSNTEKYGAIWCSHLLEHALNVNLFLRKIMSLVDTNHPIGLVVPPRKDALVGGHLNLFTPGSLCYNVIMAEQDLSKADIIIHGYNIGLFWYKKNITLPHLNYDKGDIEMLAQFFPIKVYQGINGVSNWGTTKI